MRHAILIIAHKNIEQLIRLIKCLDDNDLDIYVHLDKKWDLGFEDVKRISSATEHVTVLKKRFSGYLDTWSLCQIAIELIDTALKSSIEYSYFVLLSGQDYPIKSIKHIKATLALNYPKPLIDCTPMCKTNWIYSGFKRIRFLSYYRLVEKITSNKKTRKILLLPAYAVQIVVTAVLKSPYSRLKKMGCDMYGGSAWWILPREIVQLCVDEVRNSTGLVRAFKLKTTPEETFFQTMAMRSKLKDQIELNHPDEILQNCMTYAYFFDGEHIATGHPYILTKENVEMLRNRKELFARKFDISEDEEVLNIIDECFMKEF